MSKVHGCLPSSDRFLPLASRLLQSLFDFLLFLVEIFHDVLILVAHPSQPLLLKLFHDVLKLVLPKGLRLVA